MKKLTDQELDAIFKNAAEGYEPAFDAAAWEAMNAKLDQPKANLWKRWIPFSLLAVVLFLTGFWVGINFKESSTSNWALTESKINEALQFKNQQDRKISDHDQLVPKSIQEDNGTNIKESEKGSVEKNRSTTPRLTSNKETSNANDAMVVTGNSNVFNEEKAILKSDINSSKVESSLKKVIADSIPQQIIAIEASLDSIRSDFKEPNNQERISNAHVFFVRALASPDFSSISYATATSIGSNYALLLEYQLNNRWSISTGGILSMKKYSSDKDITYGQYTADQLTGSCQILDIPLNIYYHFLPRFKTSFYAGAGFSSYFMLEEEYTFTVNYSSGSRDYSSYIKGENNEWFKTLNLSLGMQYQMSPRIHLQAEPFLKAPLAAIGEQDVLLSSMGIFLGLKYKIN